MKQHKLFIKNKQIHLYTAAWSWLWAKENSNFLRLSWAWSRNQFIKEKFVNFKRTCANDVTWEMKQKKRKVNLKLWKAKKDKESFEAKELII